MEKKCLAMYIYCRLQSVYNYYVCVLCIYALAGMKAAECGEEELSSTSESHCLESDIHT